MSLLKGKMNKQKRESCTASSSYAAQARKRFCLFNRLFKFMEALASRAAVQITARQGQHSVENNPDHFIVTCKNGKAPTS